MKEETYCMHVSTWNSLDLMSRMKQIFAIYLFFRVFFKTKNLFTDIRQQLAGFTSFLDVSDVYGSSLETSNNLRTKEDGEIEYCVDILLNLE